MHFKIFCRFLCTFSAMAISTATDNFLANCFYIQKGCPFTERTAIFIRGSRNLHYIYILPWKFKTNGFIRGLWLRYLPLEKLSSIIKLMNPSKNSILDGFASFFLLAPYHLVLSYSSIKSCLNLALVIWRNFFAEKTNRKNVATLRTRSR
jgi:hypothetical protein